MKTNLPSLFLRLLLAAGLLTALIARADEGGATATVKLSAPDKPATLRVDMPWADIHITGVEGDTITVESSLAAKDAKPAGAGELRRLDDEVSFELAEHNNVVTLRLAGDNPWVSRDAEFKVSVPRGMALDIKTDAGGDLAVAGIEGDIEVNNMNGEVQLEGVVGAAVVNTMNGEVRLTYAKAPQKPVSITSMNGEVDLRLPADTKANLRLRTHNGSILTSFGEDVLKAKSEGKAPGYGHSREAASQMHAEAARAASEATRAAVEIAREISREVKRAARAEAGEDVPSAAPAPHPVPRPPMPPITGGKLVSGTLNGGGVDIKISTMNGEITLRETK